MQVKRAPALKISVHDVNLNWRKFRKFSSAILYDITERRLEPMAARQTKQEIMSNFVVSTNPTDSLAPSDVRTCVGKEIPKFLSNICGTGLPRWGRDEMNNISQTTDDIFKHIFSNENCD